MRRWFNSGRGHHASGHAGAKVPGEGLRLGARGPLEELAVGVDDVAVEVLGLTAVHGAGNAVLAEAAEGVIQATLGIAGEDPGVVPAVSGRGTLDVDGLDQRNQGRVT